MMYHKFINDREVFSECKTLHTEEGWISNPTPEQITADGWEVFVPPVAPVEPQDAPDYNQILEAVKKMLSTEAEQLSDEDAANVAALYSTWRSKMDKTVELNERLWDDGKLWKVITPHTVQESWRPAVSPSLFVEVGVEEWREIPENIPSTAPWMSGDKGIWKGQHYICQMDNCVWNPDVAPSFWTKVS